MKNVLCFGLGTLLLVSCGGPASEMQSAENVNSFSCRLEKPIPIGSRNPMVLTGKLWTNVELDSKIQTEEIGTTQRLQAKSLSFGVLHRGGKLAQSTGRLVVSLKSGSDSIGFPDVTDLPNIEAFESSENDRKLITTVLRSTTRDSTTREAETTKIELLMNGENVEGLALTVPVRTCSDSTGIYHCKFAGRNQRLCVKSAYAPKPSKAARVGTSP